MAKPAQKITLNASRDIPFDCLVLSQDNVRRVKAGVSIGELAEDIARRSLLQSLAVRPLLDEAGGETGKFAVPAGGRRFRALELLVKQKRLAKNALVPCIVKLDDDVPAVEDSYAENDFREPLHPLDQFRGMQAMVDAGQDVEAIAARFHVTPAVVRQRLKLATVSPNLHAVYAEDGMTLDQLMAFSVAEDHARQEQVWELLAHSYNKSAGFIRQKLTEDKVRAADKRVLFIGLDAYVEAGGCVLRDLFEPDDGGWLTDPALLDRLTDEKLQAEGARVGQEGWKWVLAAVDLPFHPTQGMRELAGTPQTLTQEQDALLARLQEEGEQIESEWADADELPEEIAARIEAIDREIDALLDQPVVYEPGDIAIAGVFVSIDRDGALTVDRGYVRAEDELVPAQEEGDDGLDHDHGEEGHDGGTDEDDEDEGAGGAPGGASRTPVSDPAQLEEGEEDALKPLSPRLVSDLTAWRTLALQDALAQHSDFAFIAVLHSLTLQTFYHSSAESCLALTASRVSFPYVPSSFKDSAPVRSTAERHAAWKAWMPKATQDLWEALLGLGLDEQFALLAHCASLTLNAQAEVIPKYDTGRISRSTVEKRIAHSDVLARSVGLDLVEAGWRPTVADYFQSVTKQRIIADVTEAKGERFASMIDHLKKGDMAREAERLLEDAGWLPEPMRTPGLFDEMIATVPAPDAEGGDGEEEGQGELPAFLAGEPALPADNDDPEDDAQHPAAA